MKFTLDSSALEGFNKNRMVEIEGFYSSDTVGEINHEVDQWLKKEKLTQREPIMALGRDLFKKSEVLRKALKLPLLGSIIYELISVRPLRLVGDQLLVGALGSFDQGAPTVFLNRSGSLHERSCLSEVVLGALVALKAKETALPFAGVPGNIVFFDPTVLIPVEWLKERLADRYLLLTFSTIHSQYIYNEADPQNHYLKHLGYVYGDKLKDSLHPIIFR